MNDPSDDDIIYRDDSGSLTRRQWAQEWEASAYFKFALKYGPAPQTDQGREWVFKLMKIMLPHMKQDVRTPGLIAQYIYKITQDNKTTN